MYVEHWSDRVVWVINALEIVEARPGKSQSEKEPWSCPSHCNHLGFCRPLLPASHLHPLEILVWDADEALGLKKFLGNEYFFPNVIFHLFVQTGKYLTQVFTYWSSKYFSNVQTLSFLGLFFLLPLLRIASLLLFLPFGVFFRYYFKQHQKLTL